jgi:hypothetical protein
MQRVLNSSVNVYGDDFIKYFKADNYLFLFTHSVMSFIYPNTLGLREFYFMSKFIRNKKNKHKLNFPIRRLYGGKIKLYNQINQCKNINVTHSSFHNTKQYSNDQVDGFRGILIDNIGNDNFIEKRGYGIDDWGGEWNDDNIKEMMFKLYNIADVNIIPEYSVKEAIKNIAPQDFEKLKFKLGTSHITEKSVSHILIAKPFIPVSYETIDFYQKMMIRYGKKYKEYPLSYSHISEIIYDIDHIASNNMEWDLLVNKLQEWVDTIRENIIEIIDTKNDLLECICSTSESNLNGKNNII